MGGQLAMISLILSALQFDAQLGGVGAEVFDFQIVWSFFIEGDFGQANQ
jgi:hypothetical protein